MLSKYNEYSLWLEWRHTGWERFLTVKRHGRYTSTARQVVYEWAWANFPGRWDRRNWMVLPAHKEPAAYRKVQQKEG